MEVSKPNTPRIIKKYANRRLYDTHKSLYITLDDLKKYVIDYTPFKVIDAKTKQDVTKAALIQIIFELEATQNPLFTEEVLAQIVRFYGNSVQTAFRDTIEKMFSAFKFNMGGIG